MFDVKVDYKPATLSAELETRKKKKLSEMNLVDSSMHFHSTTTRSSTNRSMR